MGSDKRLSPLRLPLAHARENGGPANDSRRDRENDDRESSDSLSDAEDDDTRFGAVARELGKLNTRVDGLDTRTGRVEANQTLTLQEVKKSGLLLARILERVNGEAAVDEPPAPAPAPSFADLSFEGDEEIVTAHGTKKFTYTEDALRAKMREEYMRMQKQATKKDRLVRDGKLWRFLRDDFLPKTFYFVIGAAIAYLVNRELQPVPVVSSSTPASSAAPTHGGAP